MSAADVVSEMSEIKQLVQLEKFALFQRERECYGDMFCALLCVCLSPIVWQHLLHQSRSQEGVNHESVGRQSWTSMYVCRMCGVMLRKFCERICVDDDLPDVVVLVVVVRDVFA